MLEADTAPIKPARIYGELRKRLDRDAIVIGDGGDFVSYAGKLVESYEPGTFLDPGPYGCLGMGPGYALAAGVAHPDRQVVLLLGDGAIGFALGDFESLVRHGVNVIAIVGNNGIWGLEKHPMQALFGYDVVAELAPGIRYDKVVEALGGHGELVDAPGEIGPALDRAFATPGVSLVNVLTDPADAYPRRPTSPRPVDAPRISWRAQPRNCEGYERRGRGLGAEAGAAQGLGLRAHRARRGGPRSMRATIALRSRRGSASGSTTSPTRCTASASCGVDLAAADRQLAGDRAADEIVQRAVDDVAERALGMREAGGRRRDAQVAQHREVEAAGERGTVDRRRSSAAGSAARCRGSGRSTPRARARSASSSAARGELREVEAGARTPGPRPVITTHFICSSPRERRRARR